MTRKNIPVAVPNDDGSSTIVGSDELRAQWEKHKADEVKISAGADVARIVKKYRNGKKPTAGDLLPHLALAHLSGSPIPAELAAPIASKLAGDHRWAMAQAKAKKGEAGDVWRVIEPEIRRVLEQRPGIKALPAAELVRALVARQLGDDCPSVSTIRQKISKLRKNI